MAADHLTKGRGVFLVFIISLGVGVIGWGSPASKPELCLNPPAGNPNQCHLYKWSEFPADNTFTPITGMFGNDTSYYFQYNTTGIVGFTMCANVVSEFGDGNRTITLQFTPDGTTWDNVDLAGGGTAGSVNVLSIGANCSLQNGDFQNFLTVTAGACSIFYPVCQFRIAGSMPITGPSVQHSYIIMSELNVQFYYSPAFTSQTNTVVCDSTARSLTAFTNQCMIQVARTVSTSVTLSWAATNETGTGCGANDNCWRRNTGVTCTIAIGANTCTNSITFSPAFTTTVPIVIIDWSPLVDGAFTIKPSSSILSVLT